MSTTPLTARIAELARLMEGTSLTTLTLSEGGETLTLRRGPAPGEVAPLPARTADAPTAAAVKASCPGIFLSAHPLRDAPLVVQGQAVAAGTVLGLLRAGPLLLEVTAPCPGTVLSMEARDGELVGYGSVLFHLVPTAANEAPPCPST